MGLQESEDQQQVGPCLSSHDLGWLTIKWAFCFSPQDSSLSRVDSISLGWIFGRSGPYQVANGRHECDMTQHEEVGPPSAPGCAGKCGFSSLLRTCVWHQWKLSHCLQPLSELHPVIMGSGNRSHDPSIELWALGVGYK